MRGLSLVAASGGRSSLRCAGLSLSWSLGAEHRLQMRRLSNCGSRTQLLRGMWDLPRPGLEPVSPALAGRFSTTAPPGKPHSISFVFCMDHNGLSPVWRMDFKYTNRNWRNQLRNYCNNSMSRALTELRIGNIFKRLEILITLMIGCR